jgi:hypothetical protein
LLAEISLIRHGRSHEKIDIVRSIVEVIEHARALKCAIDIIVLEGGYISLNVVWIIDMMLNYRCIKYPQTRKHPKAPRLLVIEKETIGKSGRWLWFERSLRRTMDPARFEAGCTLDPINLAAFVFHVYLGAAPSGRHDPRMARILLTVILLRYAGFVACFGGSVKERAEYLDIEMRGIDAFKDGGMEKFCSTTSRVFYFSLCLRFYSHMSRFII